LASSLADQRTRKSSGKQLRFQSLFMDRDLIEVRGLIVLFTGFVFDKPSGVPKWKFAIVPERHLSIVVGACQ
jgi:hypothetical protein